MKYKTLRPTVSVIGLAQLILLLFAVALPIVQWKANSREKVNTELEQLRLKEMQYARALNILKDHHSITQAYGDKTDSVDSITLSLIEAIKQQARAEDIDLTQLTVTQSDDPQIAPEATDTTDASVHTLSVNVAVNLDKAFSLLSLFDALDDAADWRPVEVRGCSVVRLTAQTMILHATCAVDVYYFPELDT